MGVSPTNTYCITDVKWIAKGNDANTATVGYIPANKHHSNAQQFSLSNQCQAQIEGQVTSVTSLARVNPAKASHQAPAPF